MLTEIDTQDVNGTNYFVTFREIRESRYTKKVRYIYIFFYVLLFFSKLLSFFSKRIMVLMIMIIMIIRKIVCLALYGENVMVMIMIMKEVVEKCTFFFC